VFSEGSYSEEVYLRHKPEATPAKEAVAESPPPAEGEAPTPPAAAPATEPALSAEQILDLSDDDFVSYLEKNPKGKERLERLRKNWAGNTEQEITRRAQEMTRAERQREAQADNAYAEYAALAQSNPQAWDAMTTPGTAAYREDIVGFVQQYEAWRAKKGEPETVSRAADTQKLTQELLSNWNLEGWNAVKSTLKGMPQWEVLDASFRKNVEDDAVKGDNGWWDATLKGVVGGLEKHYKKQIEAAREAGRNEALAEGDDEGPVLPERRNGKPADQMSDREIIAAYANNGTRAVSREAYHAAAKRLRLE
jgi:hypothetical protein